MKEKRVISPKSFPRKPPINITILAAVSCKTFSAPEWIWGAVGLFMLLLWIAYISKVATEKETEVDIFSDQTHINGEVPKEFTSNKDWASRLQESIKKQREGK